MNRGITRWFPLRDMDRFFDDESFWEGADFVPAINVYQDKDNVMVETLIAGVDPKNVEISVENDVLTISGKTQMKSDIKREDYYRKEIREGSFTRSVILPMQVKGDKAEASYDKGILKIRLPKAEAAKPKKIAIKVK
ncbi:MAG TPA: Hsp20/alpha crystallin family protein [Candidatus Moranbacteria bacterium]|nr:Hsp20/alpha crystallin family protein [Candidatus Moranbacteria bacterium]HQB59164.1 Hsp20/alpha crystallin family protein [Candidatus Moranbacteria bacterium]